MSDPGEFELIDSFIARFLPGAGTLVGPGDDAAVIAVPGGRIACSVDMLVEGRHFRRDWSEPEQIGARAVAASLADIAAMGGRATSLLIGLGVPAGTDVAWVQRLADGMAAEAKLVGAAVIGGDTVRSDAVIISVTALGDFGDGGPVLRSGARVGDVVAVAGRLGWAAAGLAVLSRGFRSPRKVVDAHRMPQPPYGAGPAAALAGATAMIDISDGLLADARHIASASGVALDIDGAALVVDAPVRDAAAAYNLDPLQWLLTGGDDHALLATFPAGATLPEAFVAVGRVVAAPKGAALVDGALYDGPLGFDHFR